MLKNVKLSQLKTDDDLLRLRPVNEVLVSRYRQAYRVGNDLGTLIVDASDNTIVSGNHRYTALLQEYGEDHKIKVDARKFKTRAELLECFARENCTHGMPLSGASRRAITLELLRLDVPEQEVAELFGVPVKRIEEWAEMSIVVVGSNKPQPIKRGLEVQGKPVTQEQYNTHWKADRGLPVRTQAEQLTRWLANGWVLPSDENVAALRALRQQLEKHFN